MGIFSIYVSICIFSDNDILGGLIPINNDNKEDENESAGILQYVFLVSGLISLTIAFLGCCTGKTKDRCSVGCFSITTLFFCLVFAILSKAVMQVINNYCEGKIDEGAFGFVDQAVFDVTK